MNLSDYDVATIAFLRLLVQTQHNLARILLNLWQQSTSNSKQFIRRTLGTILAEECHSCKARYYVLGMESVGSLALQGSVYFAPS